ncbi:MAG: Mov34/MPN/PAD-1 family protein, partial [Candidatus Margulisiibacteriota bacterium]
KVHSYFEKHNMKVMGFYHSHPSASFPIPSEKDIMTHKLKHLKGMMIVSLYDLKNTIMAIYNIEGNTPVEQDIKIIEDNEVNKYL